MARPLSFSDTIDVLMRLGDTAERIVLIGGQALNFWAERFMLRASELADQAPYTSKDIDFCGTQEDMAACAHALNGRKKFQSEKARSLCTGVVSYDDEHHEERQLDFLSKPHGLEADPVWEMSYPVTVAARDGRKASIRVMHPLHCLKSRVANVGSLEKYRTEHGLKQLRASIVCMRAFLESQLDDGESKVVKKLNEQVFKFCLESEDAQAVYVRHEIEPFDAVLFGDERLPSQFNAVRYPQMRAVLLKRRAESAPRA